MEKNINNIPDQKAYKPMSINNIPDQKKYKGMCLTPFKFMMMNQFPFIEDSLQEMDNYSLLCQIVNILSTATENVSNMEYNVTGLYNSYVELMNYVNKYFDNLDVQEEVNAKLDKMATDGTLDNIINQTIFNELNNEVKQNTEDIVNAQADILNNTNNITEIKNKLDNGFTIFLGDSYILGNNGKGGTINGWADYFVTLAKMEIAEYQIIGESGGGFCKKGSSTNSTFLEALQNVFRGDKTKVKNIIVAGGYNDSKSSSYTQDVIEIAINNFMTYVKENFPNANVYLGMVGTDGAFTDKATERRFLMSTNVLPAYSNITMYGGIYLNGSEFILKSNYIKNFDQEGDLHHPNSHGYFSLGSKIFEAFKHGSCTNIDVTKITLPKSSTSLTDLQILSFFNNGNITFTIIGQDYIDLIENTNISYNQVLTLANASNLPHIRPIYSRVYLPLRTTISYSGNYYNLDSYLVLHGNSTDFDFLERDVTNGQPYSGALNFTNVNRIRFINYPYTFTLNSNFYN